MNQTVTINARAIRAVQNHAATGDVRYYLNAIILRPAKSGGVVAIASDGHRFAVCHDPAGTWNAELREVIIHRSHAYAQTINSPTNKAKGWKDSALSEAVKKTKDDQTCTVSTDGQRLSVEVGGVSIAGNCVDGKAPDFRGAIRLNHVPDPSGVNTLYLADACEACAIIADDRYCAAMLHTGGADGQIVMTTKERKPEAQALRIFCIIMTLRCELEDSSKPRPLPDHAAWIFDALS